MTKLYTRLSDKFDFDNGGGVLVCGRYLEDTHGFTELGYDTADYDSSPNVYEVIPSISSFATEKQAVEAARSAGIRIFDTHEDIERANADGSFVGSWQNGDCHCLEEEPVNYLLVESPAFRSAVERSGIRGIRDMIVVGNTQPTLTLLWMPGTFELRGPLALELADGEDNPYDVRLAAGGTSTKSTSPAP